jgi:hypothetical protein
MGRIATATSNAERRADLDWVRIIAFALLIGYHVMCFYSKVTPHNQALSPRTYRWLTAPMLALSPWRLLILFIVSGAATRFMADKMTPVALRRARSVRLLPPLLFVSAVIVPPMCYVGVEQWYGYQDGFIQFLGRYFTADSHFCRPEGCWPLPFPNYYHLWFVCYLWAYTMLLIGLLTWAPSALRSLQQALERGLRGWGLILWPVAYLSVARFALGERFPQTLDLIHDWYNHAVYLGGFLLGFSIARSDAIWSAIERVRVGALTGALLSYSIIIIFVLTVLDPSSDGAAHVTHSFRPQLFRVLGASLQGFDQWLWIVAAFGFARRYLSQRDGAVRRYLTDAIFPFYIVHELTILVGGYYLTKLGLDVRLESALLITATALSCLFSYEVVRRVAWLRPLFGLKVLKAESGLGEAAQRIPLRY